MRKTYKHKIQNQSNTLKLGNMIDDMWHIHVHIMRLQRRYYRMFGKNLSAYRINAHITKLKKRTKPHWASLPSQVVQDVVLGYGKSHVQISQWTATTKPCSHCGYHNKALSLSDRRWTCPECGSHHDRDVNAAINIKRAGLAALSGADVSPS